MTHSSQMGVRTLARLLTFIICLAALAACSLSPSGQAESPTAPPAPPTIAETDPTEAPAPTEPPPTPGETAEAGPGPHLIAGEFTYSNDIITTYYVEHAAALVDMSGFVERDQEWEIPVDSQTLGFMTIDAESKRGEYRIQLPERPLGRPVDVDHDGGQDAGVQVFVACYWPNGAGGPFSEGNDPSRGWPAYLTSTVNDTENANEVIGGKLVVWAPDSRQQFPTGFGDDGRLFSDDDPVGPIAPGWSVVDLDQQPFAVSREAEQNLPLYEPNDAAVKDFSNLSYGEAFERMIERLRVEYAFNGVVGKAPDWDELAARYGQRIAEAERDDDALAFSAAIHDFTLEFRDGHVGIGADPRFGELFRAAAGGGYGFAVRELDDGRVLVVYVLEDGPAAQAGMTVGAELTRFGGKPAAQAIGEVAPFEGPFSTDFGLRTAQERYLARAPVGTSTEVTFANPGQPATTARLTAVAEFQSYLATIPGRDQDPDALPVEFRTLDSGFGYIRINSNLDDLALIMRLFERALKTFEQNEAPGLIVDLRINPGGAPLKLAGFLTDEEIPLGQTAYYSEQTGQFEPEGSRELVRPFASQYRFDKLAVLVDQTCTSACEIEAYGFSKLPGAIVVGQYPTGGVEAEVARGQYVLPDGIELQFPTGRITFPDGSLFLEGQGVQPTVRVPIDERTVLSQDDVVLRAAEQALSR